MNTHRRADGTDLRWYSSAFLVFGWKAPWLYNILDADANSCGHISKLVLTSCVWTRLLLICYTRNLRGILGKPLRPFYFRYRVNFLLFFFFTEFDFLLSCHPRNLHGQSKGVGLLVNIQYSKFKLFRINGWRRFTSSSSCIFIIIW